MCDGSGTISATPILEVLNAADFDVRRVDVDPVVFEHVSLADDKPDGQEIPVAKLLRGFATRSGGAGVMAAINSLIGMEEMKCSPGTLTSLPSLSTAVTAVTTAVDEVHLGHPVTQMNRNAALA